jgi:hypothetical protein
MAEETIPLSSISLSEISSSQPVDGELRNWNDVAYRWTNNNHTRNMVDAWSPKMYIRHSYFFLESNGPQACLLPLLSPPTIPTRQSLLIHY